MSSDRDEQRLNVDCHDCERAIRLTPGQLRAALGLMCPDCGRDLTTRGQAVLREFDAIAPLKLIGANALPSPRRPRP